MERIVRWCAEDFIVGVRPFVRFVWCQMKEQEVGQVVVEPGLGDDSL